MENSGGTGNSGGDGVVVEQIHLEEAEARLISSVQGQQVLRFFLILLQN